MPNSSVVEERVVEMRIDNAKFEAGAKKTIGILEELDRGLQGLGKQNADGFDSIGNSLDKVTDRFSAMGIIGDQILRNLTNKAIELVGQFKNMATMLTTQQIDAGWNKYADKTQAIQTIMAATSGKIADGTFADQAEQLDWVNEKIEKLNKFTDETSYNFLDMVGNIGKFTAAGRELDESVTAMQGIATWAAISGGRPAEASRAMYNLSQALGMGKVTQLDWKSIENANMATYEFKQQVIETAEELGTLQKVADGVWVDMEDHEVTVESFRENLKDGWFDSDVLLSVLGRYGDFSDKLIGYVDELDMTATDFLKALSLYEEGGVDALRASQRYTDQTIQEMLPALEELSQAEYDLGKRAFQAAQEAKTFTEAIDATKDAVSTKWMDVFELLFGNYLEAKELWTQLSETLWDIFAGPIDRLKQIIQSAVGFIGEGSGEAAEGVQQAAVSLSDFEARLNAVGKTMKDFYVSLEKTLGSDEVRKIIDSYGGLEEALLNGAISADQFKKALGSLDDTYDSAKTIGLNRALNKAGKSMADFEKAIWKVGDRAALDLIENFGGVEEALKRGGISVDLFKQALESLGIDSSNVAPQVEEQVQGVVGSLEEMREVAIGILSGDFGNGEERRKAIEEMGLDYELMQAMAGDLKNMGYELSDENLMAAMEAYYQFNNLGDRLGFATFAEYLAAATASVGESVYTMDSLAAEADDILAGLYGKDILNSAGEVKTAGELFREGLSNIMTFFDDLSTVFDTAFLRVFGGSDDAITAVENLGSKFFLATEKFWEFTKSIQLTTDTLDEAGNVVEEGTLTKLTNIITAILSPIKLIRQLLGIIFKLVGTGLSLALRLLSPLMSLVTSFFAILSDGIGYLIDWFENNSFISTLQSIGATVINFIVTPFEKLATVISTVVDYFRKGFKAGGFTEGLEQVEEAVKILFQNHPVFLNILKIIKKVATPLGAVLQFIANAIMAIGMAIGGVFYGAYTLISTVFGKLADWFGSVVDWASKSQTLNNVWGSLTNTFGKFNNVFRRVIGYAEEGYKNGGFFGALSAVGDSIQRGVKRLVPGGEKMVEIFETIRTSVGDFFSGIWSQLANFNIDTSRIEAKFNKVSNVFNTVIEGIFGDETQRAQTKQRAQDFIESIWEGILEQLRKIRLADVIGAMRLGIFASVAAEIMSTITVFKSIGKSIKSIPDVFNEVLQNLSYTLKSIALNFQADLVLKLAIAVGIISAAILVLSKIPEEKLTHAASIVIVVLGVLALIMKSFQKMEVFGSEFRGVNIQNFQIIPELMGVLIGIASVIASLGVAIGILAMVKKWGGKLGSAVAAIGVLLGGIAVILAALVWLNHAYNEDDLVEIGSMFMKFGGAMMLIALAINMLVAPIVALSLLQNFGIGKFRRSVLSIGAMILVLSGAFAIIIGATNNMNEKEIHEAGTLLMKVAGAMAIMALAIQMVTVPIMALALLQNFGPEKVFNAFAMVGTMVLAISVLVGIYTKTLEKARTQGKIEEIGKTLLRAAGAMAIMALAVNMMIGPIIALAISTKVLGPLNVIGGLTMLVGVIAIFGLILNKLNKLNINGGNMLKIAGAMALLSVALLLLAPALIAVAGAIAIFAFGLGLLTDDIWNVFEKGLGRVKKFSGTLAGFGAALLIVGLGAIMTGGGLLTFAGGVAVLTLSLAALIFVLPKFVDAMLDLKQLSSGDIMSNLWKITLMVGGLAIAVGVLALGFSKLLKIFTGKTVSGIGLGLGKLISTLATSAKNGISNTFTKVTEFLKNKENRAMILGALNGLIVLVGLYLTGIIPTLTETIADSVITLIQSVADTVSSRSDEFAAALLGLAKAIVKVFGSVFNQVFSTEFWIDMSPFEKILLRLILVIGAIKTIKTVVKTLNIASIFTRAATAIGGAKGLITHLRDAKAAIELMVEAAGGFGVILPIVAALAAALAYANHNINAQQDILEDRAFNGAAKDIEGYNTAIADTEKRITELQEAVDNGSTEFGLVQELDSLKILLKTLEKERAELEQQNALTEQLVETNKEFETGIHNVKDAMAMLKSVDLSQYGYTMDDIYHMDDANAVEVAREIERQMGSAWGAVTEKQNEFNASFDLTKKTVIEGADEITTATSKVSTAVAATEEKAAGLWDQFKGNFQESGLGGLLGMFGDFDVMGAFEEAVAAQGININDLIKVDGTGFDKTAITNLLDIDQLKADLKAKAQGLGPAIPEGIAEAIPGYEGLLSGSMLDMSSEMIDSFCSYMGIASPSKVFTLLGQHIPEGVGEGVDQGTNSATTATSNLATAVVNSFGNFYDTFVAHGVNVVQGLVDGINNNLEAAYTAGANLGTSVENGYRDQTATRSPSKVFMRLGGYLTEGLSKGIEDGQSMPIDSIVVLSDALISAIQRSMAMVSLMADDDFSISPTITPVVDMSNINAASGMLGNAFGGQYGVSAQLSNSINSRLSDVERLAASMGNQQTINNGDVFNFNIYAAEGQDEEAIADAVMNRMQTRMVRRGAAFGA